MKRIRASLRDYLWLGTAHRIRARMSWTDYYIAKLVGGLELMDPIKALYTLLAKWVLKAMLPRASN